MSRLPASSLCRSDHPNTQSLSIAIHAFSGVLTIVTPFSVLLAFFISIAVGIAFGLFPAKRAAEQDPVVCLRYE